ncbi:MAG: MFS transporter [Candidatus Nanopelagicales bacterium]
MTAEADATSVGSIFSGQYRALTLGIVAIMTIAAFEGMGVITAMPAAAQDLDGLTLYGWGSTAFAVTGLFAMATAGGWADHSGPLPPLTCGLAIFVGGLIMSGSAPTMLVLLCGRGLQGLGFGGVIVALYVVIGRAYPNTLRPRVFTALSGAWVVPGITGPLIAGVITETVGWRWVFFGVLALLLPVAVVLLPRLKAIHIPPDRESEPLKRRKTLALLAATGAGLLQYAGQRLDGFGLLIAVPAVLLLWISVPKLLPAGAFRLRRGLPTVVMVRGFFAGAFFGAEWFIPLLLVSERSQSYALAGGALSGAAIGWFIGSWYQGRPSTQLSRYSLVGLGSAMTTIGIAASMLIAFQAVPWWIIVFTWSVGSFGMGILYGSLGVLLLDLSLPEEQGINSAALQMADSLGVIACTGLGGVIFAAGHSAAGEDGDVYVAIFSVMVCLAVFATAISGRVRPREPVFV